MPHAFRTYKALKIIGFSDEQSITASGIIEHAKEAGSRFDRESAIDILYDGGFDEYLAEAVADVLRNCYPSEKFGPHFDPVSLKSQLVRAKLSADRAEKFLLAVDPAVVTLREAYRRVAIQFPPSPGKVTMCDFTHLEKPEMTKERRVIVVARRKDSVSKLCTVVPVSMDEKNEGNAHYHKFEPGCYPFFSNYKPVLAICDHVYTVSLKRLWQAVVSRRPVILPISESDLAAVRRLLGTSLGLSPD